MRQFRGSDRFKERVGILGGPRTFGTFIHASDTSNPGQEISAPRMTLRVPRNSLVTPGQCILGAGAYYLTGRATQTPDYQTLTLFEADRQVRWTRTTTKIDPVTKQQVADGDPTFMGNIWVLWQRLKREFKDAAIHMEQDTLMTMTVSPVLAGDYLDGIRVKRIDSALGLWVLELQS